VSITKTDIVALSVWRDGYCYELLGPLPHNNIARDQDHLSRSVEGPFPKCVKHMFSKVNME